MDSVQKDIDERSNLTGTNKFELLLFRLGESDGNAELYGINVFKIREIVAMPPVTAIAGSVPHMMGVVNLRGQIISVLDLPAIVGCKPKSGLNILLVTEFARSTQAFAVEAVEDIVRLDWSQVMTAEGNAAQNLVTSIARLDTNTDSTRLAQVLDVETILRQIFPSDVPDVRPEDVGPRVELKPGAVILAADDSTVARMLIQQGLEAMGTPYIMTKSGKEAWDCLQDLAAKAAAEGVSIRDKVALVLSDLEMPEMDGFTLTRNIKQSDRFKGLPVVIHSSLSGSANEGHVKNVGADAYIAKFQAEDLASTIRRVLAQAG
jgi:two-component system, chemotaxis family, chemotaxis protein CheV